MKRDYEPKTVAQLLELLERGRVGHRFAMDWFGIDSYPRLVRIMHLNGRRMPGHKPMRIRPETMELLRKVMRPARKRAA
jgi:hypothetical protein